MDVALNAFLRGFSLAERHFFCKAARILIYSDGLMNMIQALRRTPPKMIDKMQNVNDNPIEKLLQIAM
ncbi:MAG: hypothetical protein CSA81_13715 [Acidobacteria bacterium]|nr:MAG: hypothetical protein CSA81_13715 [Acidobacteriota bacterium]